MDPGVTDKDWEVQTAQQLNARRIPLSGRHHSAHAFESDWIVGGAQLRGRLPKWLTRALDKLRPFAGTHQLPILVLGEQHNRERAWVLMTLDDFVDFFVGR